MMKYNVYNQKGELIGDGVNLRMAVAKILTNHHGDEYCIKKDRSELYYIEVYQNLFFKKQILKTRAYPSEQMLFEHVLRINYRGCWVEEVDI